MATSNCDNCVYRTIIGGMASCNYLFITGQRRPCPPGDDCTVKVGRKVNRRKKKAKNSAIDEPVKTP